MFSLRYLSITAPVRFFVIFAKKRRLSRWVVEFSIVFILGEAYNSFVAKDISRAFVTGEFESKSIKDSLDHVLGMSPSELVALKKWKDFYLENYDLKGKMIGR